MSLTLLTLAVTASAVAPPRLLVDRLFAAFNRHDAAALQALYAPEARLTSSDFCNARSGTDVTRTYQAIFEATPDIRDDVISVVIHGDQGFVRFRSSSKAPANAFDFELMTYFRFSKGRIVEDDTVFDTKGRPCET